MSARRSQRMRRRRKPCSQAVGSALARWIDGNGYQSTGYPREISLECPPNRDEWVTELQAPVAKS